MSLLCVQKCQFLCQKQKSKALFWLTWVSRLTPHASLLRSRVSRAVSALVKRGVAAKMDNSQSKQQLVSCVARSLAAAATSLITLDVRTQGQVWDELSPEVQNALTQLGITTWLR